MSVDLPMHFFIHLAVTLAACWTLGLALRRIGQRQVVVDMTTGALPGPMRLGFALPGVQERIFPSKLAVGDSDRSSPPRSEH